MTGARVMSGLVAVLLITVAPGIAQACKFTIAEVSFRPGAAVISRAGDAELVRWAGGADAAKGRTARVNVAVDPKADGADAALQRARGETVAARLRGLGLRREDIVVSVFAGPPGSPSVSVWPNPVPCRP